MAENTQIFINYRQVDCTPLANHLANIFRDRLEEGSFFLDKESIDYGKSISEEIQQHLDSAKALLVLIGPGWHWVQDEFGDKRLLNEQDWVRREIEMAHEQRKLIVPVLYNHESYSEVCAWLKKKVNSLAFLPGLKYFPIKDKTLEEDTTRLISFLESELSLILKPAAATSKTSAHQEQIRQELDKHFPIAKAYSLPTSEVPFFGLEYFKKEDAPLFFGRSRETLKLCRAVENFNLILLYGQSGVGKSSLLNAGILARLEPAYHSQYLRRDKGTGFHQQTEKLLEEGEQLPERSLIILDQVEEMFTDPRADKSQEASAFVSNVQKLLHDFPECKIVLGFRSEYFPNIRDLLRQEQLLITEDQELYLKPLTREGIKEAITGIVSDKHLKNHYRLKIEEKLVDVMTESLLANQREESHIGPLLQYQLRKLWDEAAEKRK